MYFFLSSNYYLSFIIQIFEQMKKTDHIGKKQAQNQKFSVSVSML